MPYASQIAIYPAKDSASLTDESKVTRRALKIPGNVFEKVYIIRRGTDGHFGTLFRG